MMQRLDETLRSDIKITNVVCTADLKQPIDIGKRWDLAFS